MGLSIWQLKRQLAFLAALATWSETPQALVYSGGGFVSEDLEGNFRMGSLTIDGPTTKTGADNAVGDTPFCRVQCLRTEWDKRSNSSRIDRALMRLWSSAGGGAVPGTPSQTGFDTHGINQVTGLNRATANGQGKSQGRDVDELIGRLVETYGFFVDSMHGFQGRAAMTDALRKVSGSLVLKRALDVEVFGALQSNYYHPLFRFTATAGVAGSVTLAWIASPLRFDSLPNAAATRTIRIRRGATSGAAAPTDPESGGTLITTTMAAGTYSDTPGAGTWNYSAWVPYGETPAAQTALTPDRFSSRLTAGATT